VMLHHRLTRGIMMNRFVEYVWYLAILIAGINSGVQTFDEVEGNRWVQVGFNLAHACSARIGLINCCAAGRLLRRSRWQFFSWK
jgi:hypothetical protein